MNLYNISSEIKFLNQIGATLSVDERLKLELALLRITEQESFDQILFWGKVEGTTKDYYLAVGLNFKGKYEFPIKKFFWTSTDFEFSQLPPINPEYSTKVDSFKGFFSGQHDKILVQVAEEEEGGGEENAGENAEGEENQNKPVEDSDDEVVVKVPPKNFTELDRLAYVVRAIDIDCQCVPVGAFKLTPTHELRYNDAFRGLQMGEALKLSNYQHFRNPQSEEKKALMLREDALFQFDFLDPVCNDLPMGSWSIQSDSSKTNVTVRSLLWPGYLAYHRANTNVFGGVYFGTGVKDVDLPFFQ